MVEKHLNKDSKLGRQNYIYECYSQYICIWWKPFLYFYSCLEPSSTSHSSNNISFKHKLKFVLFEIGSLEENYLCS